MKFCKALQKVMEASDPSYRPYWTNYKKLKKMIKAIDAYGLNTKDTVPVADKIDIPGRSSRQEKSFVPKNSPRPDADAAWNDNEALSLKERMDSKVVKACLKHNPGEVAFFQLLHAELLKASDFFGKAEQQFVLREEIIRMSMEVLKRPLSATVKDRWAVLSKAVFRLHRDLMLLETYAIMTYFAFSKILKKHDKVTGIETRGAFMINIVNKANFTNYPRIMDMIQGCQAIYQDASQRLLQGMYEDERLFLHMVEQIQHQSGARLQLLSRDVNCPQAPQNSNLEVPNSITVNVANREDEDRKPQARTRNELESRPMKKRRVRFHADWESGSR